MKSNLFYLDVLLIILIVIVLIFIIYHKNKNETFVQSEIPGVNDGNIYNYGIAVGDWVHWWSQINSPNPSNSSELINYGSLVLTATPDNKITHVARITPSDDSQLWMFTSQGLIINKKNNMAVTIPNVTLNESTSANGIFPENIIAPEAMYTSLTGNITQLFNLNTTPLPDDVIKRFGLNVTNALAFEAILTPITGAINQRFTLNMTKIFSQSVPFQIYLDGSCNCLRVVPAPPGKSYSGPSFSFVLAS